MADTEKQIPGGAYVNDVAEAALYQRQIPGSNYINETEQTAGGVQMFLLTPTRTDGVGHGGIFPGGRL